MLMAMRNTCVSFLSNVRCESATDGIDREAFDGRVRSRTRQRSGLSALTRTGPRGPGHPMMVSVLASAVAVGLELEFRFASLLRRDRRVILRPRCVRPSLLLLRDDVAQGVQTGVARPRGKPNCFHAYRPSLTFPEVKSTGVQAMP